MYPWPGAGGGICREEAAGRAGPGLTACSKGPSLPAISWCYAQSASRDVEQKIGLESVHKDYSDPLLSLLPGIVVIIAG